MLFMAALLMSHPLSAQNVASPTQRLSPSVKQLTEWILDTGDHRLKSFYVVDKVKATLHVFDLHGRLQASTPVLLGAAIGDDSVLGIGQRPMAQISPAERTTPAGRFLAESGPNLHGEQVVWVDYDTAFSMHRVRVGVPHERRAERLQTLSVTDNRISYGCINVPVAFYDRYIQPAFDANATGMVYVLPETAPLQDYFGDLQPVRLTKVNDRSPSTLPNDEPQDEPVSAKSK